MFDFLEVSLDVATAFSIIGAALTFFIQNQREKRADRDAEKWFLLKQLVDDFAEYKAEIANEIMRNHAELMKEEDQHNEVSEEAKWQIVNDLRSKVNRIITGAYFYVEYNLRPNAQAVVHHFENEKEASFGQFEARMATLIDEFRNNITEQCQRLEKSGSLLRRADLSPKKFYITTFLRDVGLRTLGIDVNTLPKGEEPDENWKELIEETGYPPRQFIGEEDQPPTILEVFDKFSDKLIIEFKI